MNKELIRCEDCGQLYDPVKKHKCKHPFGEVLEINCNKCVNCTGERCKIYGDNPNEAVQACANDGFENYAWY